MNVLSLFDGISIARQALKNCGIKVDNYYASEIDKYAIQVSQKNWPDIIQLGDIKKITYHLGYDGNGGYYLPSGIFLRKDIRTIRDSGEGIDLLIGGSPCQDLSISKSKTRKGLDGDKSSLFYEYLRILKEVDPKYFILENVASMSDENRNIISKELGVYPVELNARDFSAQDRARYFWTNIPIKIPSLKNQTTLGDILENNVNEKYYYKDVPFEIYEDKTKRVVGKINVSGHDILKRIYNPLMKSPTITTCAGGNTQHKVIDNNMVRKLTPIEYERLQSLPDDYTEGISNSQRYKCCGNGFNCAVIEHILKSIPN